MAEGKWSSLQPEGRQFEHLHAEVSLGKMLELALIEQQSAANRCCMNVCVNG